MRTMLSVCHMMCLHEDTYKCMSVLTYGCILIPGLTSHISYAIWVMRDELLQQKRDVVMTTCHVQHTVCRVQNQTHMLHFRHVRMDPLEEPSMREKNIDK